MTSSGVAVSCQQLKSYDYSLLRGAGLLLTNVDREPRNANLDTERIFGHGRSGLVCCWQKHSPARLPQAGCHSLQVVRDEIVRFVANIDFVLLCFDFEIACFCLHSAGPEPASNTCCKPISLSLPSRHKQAPFRATVVRQAEISH